MNESLQRAIKIVGSRRALARALNISPAAVSQWTEVPVKRVLAIEALTDGAVCRHELRPDIYPSSPKTEARGEGRGEAPP